MWKIQKIDFQCVYALKTKISNLKLKKARNLNLSIEVRLKSPDILSKFGMKTTKQNVDPVNGAFNSQYIHVFQVFKKKGQWAMRLYEIHERDNGNEPQNIPNILIYWY